MRSWLIMILLLYSSACTSMLIGNDQQHIRAFRAIAGFRHQSNL